MNLLLFFLSVLFFFSAYIADAADKGTDIPKTPEKMKRTLPAPEYSSTYSRLCKNGDITGSWAVVKWTPYFYIHAKDWNKPMFMKFQWYIFYKNHTLKNMSANMNKDFKDVLKLLAPVKSPLKYEISENGIMRIFGTAANNKKFEELWRCALVTKDVDASANGTILKKGDLMMTLLGRNNEILFVRQLRKIGTSISKLPKGGSK